MTIRFVLPWRGREPGQIDSQLDHGVAAELVRRGLAEPADGKRPQGPQQPAVTVQSRPSGKVRR